MTDRVLGLPRGAWLVVAIVLAVLAAVAALIPPRGTPGIEVADLGETLATVLHGVGYAVLAATAMLAQRQPRPIPTALLVIAYGVLLEIVQGALGQRSAQWVDLAANSAGVVLGIVVALPLARRATA